MTLKLKIPAIVMPPPGESWRDKLGRLPWDQFCTVSLFNWLDAVRRAEIPHVAATEIWRGPISSILQFDQKGPHSADLEAMDAAVKAAAGPGKMVRWDCCAGHDVKGRIGGGNPEWHEYFAELYIDDPRAFDLIYEYPRDDMIVWSRPWVKAAIHDGYPVEFRVYVKDGAAIGVSNYYPQMDLPESYAPDAKQAMDMTRKLISVIKAPVWVPHDGGADRWAQDSVHGTVDWLLTQDGQLLFLEGGPPFGAGAHPCCFLGKEGVDGWAFKTDVPKDELH